jgi:hypothetical protein
MQNNETKVNINSIKDLIKLGESNLLTPSQYLLVIQSCNPFIGIFLNDYGNTLDMANILDSHLLEWGNNPEKPLFIDVELNKEPSKN